MSVIELTQSNFDETITNNEIVIIDFWAPWCGPCLQFAPTFKETSEKVQGVTFTKINTEEEKSNFNYDLVLMLPTLIKRPVLIQGEKTMVGFSEHQYAKLIDGVKSNT